MASARIHEWLSLIFSVFFISSVYATRESDTQDIVKYHVPGAIVEPMGQIMVTQNTIILHIDLLPLSMYGEQIHKVRSHLDFAREHAAELNESDTKHVIVDKLDDAGEVLLNILPESISQMRTKRALLPFVGTIMSKLFGTASQSDLDAYKLRLTTMKNWALSNEKLLLADVHAIKNHAKIIQNLQSQLLTLNLSILTVGSQSNHSDYMNYLYMKTDRLCDTVTKVVQNLENFLQDIVFASHSIITSTLLTPHYLAEIVQMAMSKFHFRPIVPIVDINLYYPLMKSELLDRAIFIEIPFVSEEPYNMYALHKFPVEFEDDLFHAVVDTTKLVVLSPSKDFISFLDPILLGQCQSSVAKLYVCPSSMLLLESISTVMSRPDAACALALINDLNLTEKCLYEHVMINDTVVLHANHLYYIFFPHTLHLAQYTCPNSVTRIDDPQGSYVIPESCGLRADGLKVLPTISHTIKSKMLFHNLTLTKLTYVLPSRPNTIRGQTEIHPVTVSDVLLDESIRDTVTMSRSFLEGNGLPIVLCIMVFIFILVSMIAFVLIYIKCCKTAHRDGHLVDNLVKFLKRPVNTVQTPTVVEEPVRFHAVGEDVQLCPPVGTEG